MLEYKAMKEFLQESIKSIPSLRYALGIIGMVSAIGIIKTFSIDFKIAIFGIVIMLILMFALMLFSRISNEPNQKHQTTVLSWTFLIIIVATTCLLFSSAFFNYPIKLREYIIPTQTQLPVINIEKLHGIITDKDYAPLQSASIWIEKTGETVQSDKNGNYEFNSLSVNQNEITKITVDLPKYKSESKLVEFTDPTIKNVKKDFVLYETSNW